MAHFLNSEDLSAQKKKEIAATVTAKLHQYEALRRNLLAYKTELMTVAPNLLLCELKKLTAPVSLPTAVGIASKLDSPLSIRVDTTEISAFDIEASEEKRPSGNGFSGCDQISVFTPRLSVSIRLSQDRKFFGSDDRYLENAKPQ